jgi:serine/threonine-protein kinase
MRVGLSDPILAHGLDTLPDRGPPKDREIGEVRLVNTDKEKADAPSIDCGAEGCYVVWQGEAGGAYAAYLDASRGQILWRKRFDPKGSRPSIALAPSGAAELAWIEGGRVKLASISRDGVGAPTVLARTLGDQPAPSIAPGSAPGEWYLAWLDVEAGHPEVYVARALCK